MKKQAAITRLILETFRLNGRLLVVGDALVADVGLTSARWQVIGAIAHSLVPLPMAHIARNMGLTRQSVRRLVHEMEREGLVRFAPNPHHERAQLVVLTAKGKSAFDAAMRRQEPWASSVMGGLTGQQIEIALTTLRSIRRQLDDQAENGID